jgi:hypothetical protein
LWGFAGRFDQPVKLTIACLTWEFDDPFELFIQCSSNGRGAFLFGAEKLGRYPRRNDIASARNYHRHIAAVRSSPRHQREVDT